MNDNQQAIWDRAQQILNEKKTQKGKKPESKNVSVKLVQEVLVLGGRLNKTRQWVPETSEVIKLRSAGSVEHYKKIGHNAKGVPVYEFMEEPEDVEDGGD